MTRNALNWAWVALILAAAHAASKEVFGDDTPVAGFIALLLLPVAVVAAVKFARLIIRDGTRSGDTEARTHPQR